MNPIDYLDFLRRDSALLADAVDAHPLDTPVPTCPGWSLEALAAHLATVQAWAAAMVEARAQARLDRSLLPAPPAGRAVAGALREATGRLLRAFDGADPATPMWFWTAGGTVASWARRQAHEAAVHRWDAQAAVGTASPLEPALADDGVDELLELHRARAPERFAGGPATLCLHATDTGSAWLFRLGPQGLDLARRAGEAEVEGRATASDLDLFLWGRLPAAALEATGRADLLDRLQRLTAL